MSTTVKKTGPLFVDGQVEQVMDDFATDAEKAIGDYALAVVGDELRANIQHSTGRYISHVSVETLQDDVLITDGGVVYGPWLEGTSTRNKTTRFKGYASFRRATKRIQDRAAEIAERVLPQHIRRLS